MSKHLLAQVMCIDCHTYIYTHIEMYTVYTLSVQKAKAKKTPAICANTRSKILTSFTEYTILSSYISLRITFIHSHNFYSVYYSVYTFCSSSFFAFKKFISNYDQHCTHHRTFNVCESFYYKHIQRTEQNRDAMFYFYCWSLCVSFYHLSFVLCAFYIRNIFFLCYSREIALCFDRSTGPNQIQLESV